MTKVIIVRHGQSTYNAVKRIQGHNDLATLTEKGRNDAIKVGLALQNITFDAIYHSPLQRAKQTAEIIYPRLHATSNSVVPQANDKLKEIHLSAWEGMLRDEVKVKFAQDYRIWREAPHLLQMHLKDNGGTKAYFPVLALYTQAREFWREILPRHPQETILIVAHSGINRVLISTALEIAPSRYQCIEQSNCCINAINFALGWGEGVQLESFNQTQHMGEILPPRRLNPGVRLLLVRHGETEWNQQKRYQGQIDVPLNAEGKKQSQLCAELLKTVTIDFAFSSPMVRAQETAKIILQHHLDVKLELMNGFQEILHGLWQGKSVPEVASEFPEDLQRWRTAPTTVQMPKGENVSQVWKRTIAAYESIVHTALTKQLKTGLIVAHGVTNLILLCHILGLSPAHLWNFRQGNGAVSVIDYPAGLNGLMPMLLAMNITSHLGGGVLDKTTVGAL